MLLPQSKEEQIRTAEAAAAAARAEAEARRKAYIKSLPPNSPQRLTIDFYDLFRRLQLLFDRITPQFEAWHVDAEAEYKWNNASDSERAVILQERQAASEGVASRQVTALFRGMLARKKAFNRREAVTTIQRFGRRVVMLVRERSAATKIQSVSRKRRGVLLHAHLAHCTRPAFKSMLCCHADGRR